MQKPGEYLKDKSYYSDLYDRFTVEKCRRWESEDKLDDLPSIEGKNPKEQKIKKEFTVKVVIPTALYFIKGEEYARKAETIREWMERDRARDEKEANAVEPEGIHCLACSSLMTCTSRDLHTDIDDKNNRVLFFFNCSKCQKHRAFWEGGKEWERSSTPCPKCNENMESANSRKNNVITTTYTCSNCGNKETDTLDLDEKTEEPIDLNFEKDRARFCLTDKQGQEYLETKAQLEGMKQLVDQLDKEEKNKEVYKKARALQKLTVVQVQNLLIPVLKKQGYINLSFKQPELGREVSLEFAVQDSRGDRQEYDSKSQLKKLIQKTLEDTAWRLMSDGISYRLGILTGRIRAHEKEEDLLKLVTPIVRQKNNAKT